VILLAGLWALGCGRSEKLDPEVDRLGRASGPVEPGLSHPPQGMPRSGSPDSSGGGRVHAGSIAETIQVPNYTYIRLTTEDGNELWTAVPSTEVTVGQPARVVESLVMKDFTSRTLSRTFESIVFGVLEGQPPPAGGAMPPTPAGELPPGHPPIDAGPATPTGAT
jgi:hypothetical protein